ncbi:MAG: hypothetical protein WCG85_18505 [Polyangia bacterium]
MTNKTRSTQCSLVAFVLATLLAACTPDPTAGIGPLTTGGGAGGASPTAGGTGGAPGGATTSTFTVLEGWEPAVDILFVIDNSPSMDPKQQALANNFPKMINALKELPGGLPDVHIGVVSSNMGAGNGAMGGNCGMGLGDRGLLWGNDPNDLAASVAAASPYANDPSHPLSIPGCGLFLGARWIEDVQSFAGTGRIQNYDPSIQLEDVFSCLARAVGVSGCGEEHQLQATRVALIPQSGINDANSGFLRSNAYLLIVLVTDEDDCSASNNNQMNDDMFDMVTKRDVGDTTSLRCAARGHLCGGQPIPNYDPSVGYTGTTAFAHPFSDCSAKVMPDPNHPDYSYLPLIDVQDVIDNINGLKVDAQDRIFVSGIIGWPPGPNDTNLPASLQINANYRIDKDTTSLPPSQQTLWDYMPVCQDPNQMSADGNIYKAYGGLRLKKFIDAFGDNGMAFSICNSDFTDALTQIGNALATRVTLVLTPGCFPYTLMDADPNTPGVQPACQVSDEIPCDRPGVGGCQNSGYQRNALYQCVDIEGATASGPLNPANPQIDNVPDDERPCWYLSYDTDPNTGCAAAPNGQKFSVLRPKGTAAPLGANLEVTCQTCPASNPGCAATAP